MNTTIRNIDPTKRPFRVDAKEQSLRDADDGKRIGDLVEPSERALRMSSLAADVANGRLVKMDLGAGDVRAPATEATFASNPNDFVADTVAPVVLVKHDRGFFFGEDVNDTISLVIASGDAFGARTQEINPSLNSTAFNCVPYALACEIAVSTQNNADFDVMAVGVTRIVEQLRLAREIRVRTLLTTPGNWAGANVTTLGATAKWNAGASKTPLFDIFARMDASSLAVTTIVLPEKLEPWFGTDTSVVNFIMAGRQFPRIVVARAKVKAAGIASYVWQNDVVLVREPDSAMALSTARTLRWLGGEVPTVDGYAVREYRLSGVGSRGTNGIVVTCADAEVFVSNLAGGLISAAFQ